MRNAMLGICIMILAIVFVTGCGKTYKGKGVVENGASEQQTQSESGWITTDIGLRYLDHVIGQGEEAVKGMTVEVHYTGWLWEDGKRGEKFDSSHDRNQTFKFQLGAGRVIKGWDEGVVGMKVGGKRELIIPPELGYGSRGAGGVIPPNATLDFEVEFVGVANP